MYKLLKNNILNDVETNEQGREHTLLSKIVSLNVNIW